MSKYDELDPKCIRCVLTQRRFDLEIDCEDCKYYYEKLAKGEIRIVEDDVEEE